MINDSCCSILGKPKPKRWMAVTVDGKRQHILVSESTFQNIMLYENEPQKVVERVAGRSKKGQ
jgi:hypothetical protein